MRGALELPAVAIFTIVAGSLIVLLFVSISSSQGEKAQADTQARSLQFLDTLLKTASTSRDTQNNITIIDEQLRFSCDESGTWFGYEGSVQLPLSGIIVFSPRELEGGELLFFTLGSDVPYRSANILYLASHNTVVYVAPDLSSSVDLTRFKFEMASGASPSPLRFRTIKGSLPQLNELQIVPDSNDAGTVTWFTATGRQSAVYPNKELLYGAILSKDKETYECGLKKYLAQVRFANAVQWERVQELRSSENILCVYEEFPFADIRDATQAWPFDIVAARKMVQAQNSMRFINDNLLLGDRCAAIY